MYAIIAESDPADENQLASAAHGRRTPCVAQLATEENHIVPQVCRNLRR